MLKEGAALQSILEINSKIDFHPLKLTYRLVLRECNEAVLLRTTYRIITD